MKTFINSFDLFWAETASKLNNSTGVFFTPLFKAITTLGNVGIIFIILSIIFLIFKKTRKVGILSGIALLFGLLFTNILLKNLVARPRPYLNESSRFYKIWLQAGALKESGFSFPSGHSTAASAFSVSAFLFFNKKYSWLFLFIPFLMGFTRIYFVVHYASDVICGILTGSIAAVCSWYVVKVLSKISGFAKFVA